METDQLNITLLPTFFWLALVLVTSVAVAVWRWRPSSDSVLFAATGYASAVNAATSSFVPFLCLHDPDWRLLGKAMSQYERELSVCLGGLSLSLEVCHQSEAALGLKNGFLSRTLQAKIDKLAHLQNSNVHQFQQLLHEFPIFKMLPERAFIPQSDDDGTIPPPPPSPSNDQPPPRKRSVPVVPSSYDSIDLIMAHLVRDWTQEGAAVRMSLYEWCRSQVKSTTTSAGRRQQSILVPGAGLGRLAWDLAQDGHSVEANEVSLTMAAVAYHLFQKKHSKTFTLHPFVTDFFMNEVNSQLRYQVVTIEPPMERRMIKGHLSYTLGDFVQLYGSPQSDSTHDVVITCFFLDTATNVFDYLAVVSNVLTMGGQWINIGPLQWHSNAHLHLAADELKELIPIFGFRIDHWSIDTQPIDYRTEDPTRRVRFLKFEGYQPLRIVATKVKAISSTSKHGMKYPVPATAKNDCIPRASGGEGRLPPPVAVVSKVTIEEL